MEKKGGGGRGELNSNSFEKIAVIACFDRKCFEIFVNFPKVIENWQFLGRIIFSLFLAAKFSKFFGPYFSFIFRAKWGEREREWVGEGTYNFFSFSFESIRGERTGRRQKWIFIAIWEEKRERERKKGKNRSFCHFHLGKWEGRGREGGGRKYRNCLTSKIREKEGEVEEKAHLTFSLNNISLNFGRGVRIFFLKFSIFPEEKGGKKNYWIFTQKNSILFGKKGRGVQKEDKMKRSFQFSDDKNFSFFNKRDPTFRTTKFPIFRSFFRANNCFSRNRNERWNISFIEDIEDFFLENLRWTKFSKFFFFFLSIFQSIFSLKKKVYFFQFFSHISVWTFSLFF